MPSLAPPPLTGVHVHTGVYPKRIRYNGKQKDMCEPGNLLIKKNLLSILTIANVIIRYPY